MSAGQNRAEQIRAKAQRIAAAAAPSNEVEEVRTYSTEESRSRTGKELRTSALEEPSTSSASGPLLPAISTPVRTRPVRLSVDIAPNEHTELARQALAAAAELGVVRVHGQEIVRAVLRRYLNDLDLQRAVLADIRNERRAR